MTTITVLSDVILPEIVMSAGVRGRQIRRNERTQTINGSVEVNVQWDHTLREFEVGYVPMLPAAWSAIEGLFEVTDAGAYGLLMFDPKDSVVSTTEGKLITYNSGFPLGTMGSGYGEPVHYLFKRYTSVGSTQYRDRPIGRPLNPIITRAGSPVTVGAAAGNIAIDAEAGKVTFVADASQALTSITAGASTVLTFANNSGMVAAMAVGQRVYLTGISGTVATTLNGKSHAVTAKDTVAFTLTISTVTTGLTGTGGTALKYPQASEALAWSGRFYIPVHFMNDEMDWELVRSGPSDTRMIAGPSVTLMQILEMPE